ncbi:MAG: GNAT family N-acetyltransferase [Saprospiraceae bacterium]
MKIRKTDEYKISYDQALAINALLTTCFSGFPSNRNYYRSLPSFRLLAWKKDKLIGQLAVVFRVIKVGSTVVRVFGISDVCVHPDHRDNNCARLLLDSLDDYCQKYRIDFQILIAEEQKFYEKRSYQSVSNTVRWLLINDHQSLGVMHGTLDNSLMIKQTGKVEWNEGLLDLLGGVF